MTVSTDMQLELSSEDCFLLGNVSNEVLRGFQIKAFDLTIGTSRDEYKTVLEPLFRRQDLPTRVGQREIVVLRNALAATLVELGPGEFHTRTGVHYEYGQDLLKRMELTLSYGKRG